MKHTIVICSTIVIIYIITIFLVKIPEGLKPNKVFITNIVEKPVEKPVEKIVEKPVKEYVTKYITNVVEKMVESEMQDTYKKSMVVYNKILNSKQIDFDKLPPGIESIEVDIYIAKSVENMISKSIIKDAIEIEARKVGLKIDQKSPFKLFYSVDCFENGEYSYANHFELSLIQNAYFMSDDNLFYKKRVEIWGKSSFGSLGKKVLNQKYVLDDVSEKMISFCNKYLEAKQN